MVHSQRDIEIGQPIDVVFDFLADGANNPRWQPRVVETNRDQDSARAPALTTANQCATHSASRSPPTTASPAFDRPRSLQFEVTSGGPIRPTGAYQLTSTGPARTRVRFTIECKPRRAIVLAIPFLPFVQALFDRETLWIDRAKRVLESVEE